MFFLQKKISYLSGHFSCIIYYYFSKERDERKISDKNKLPLREYANSLLFGASEESLLTNDN